MKIVQRKYLTIGKFLKKKRVAIGLTQDDVKRVLGYTSAQVISDWERGVCGPPIESLSKLCKAYKMSTESIVDLILSAERTELESLLKVGRRS